MKIFKWVVINLVVLVALLFSIGICLPQKYHVERSVVIDAPMPAIFAHVDNLRDWEKWSAWTKERYPGMTVTYGEKDSGTGAEYSWTIPDQGSGTLRLTGSNMGYGVGYALEMDGGKNQSAGLFQFKPAESGTRVIWTNQGEVGWSPIERYTALLMDRMMGPDFQTGLDNLKRLVEAEPREVAAAGGGGGGRGGRGGFGRRGRGGGGLQGPGAAQGDAPPATDATQEHATPAAPSTTTEAPAEVTKAEPSTSEPAKSEPTKSEPAPSELSDKPATDAPAGPTDKAPSEPAASPKVDEEAAKSAAPR